MLRKSLRRIGVELLFLLLVFAGLTAFVTLQQGARAGLQSFWVLLRRNLALYGSQIAQGNLGQSDRYQSSMLHLVGQAAEITFGLLAAGLLLALLLGIAKGIWDSRSLNRARFSISPLFSSLFGGMPDFWLVLVLQWAVILSVRALNWRPFLVYWESKQVAESLVLPLLAITLIPLGIIARQVAQALGEIETTDYIRTARAKGLSPSRVQLRHALRPALVHLLGALPGILSVMLSNLAVAEYLTGTPGLLGLLLRSIWDPKGGLVLATDGVLLITAGMLLAVLVLLLYEGIRVARGLVDPRLQGVGQ